jgi:hypothetical protein
MRPSLSTSLQSTSDGLSPIIVTFFAVDLCAKIDYVDCDSRCVTTVLGPELPFPGRVTSVSCHPKTTHYAMMEALSRRYLSYPSCASMTWKGPDESAYSLKKYGVTIAMGYLFY